MSEDMLGLSVLQAGVQSSLQDLGRFGHADQGISQGGAMDLHAHCWSNKLLGNDPDCAVLELTVGMAKFRAESDMQLALAGADMQAELNGVRVGNWRSFFVQAGDEISLKAASDGMRAYLAVAGGFLVHECLGSVSTVVRNGLGGMDGSGSLLGVGDFLAVGESTGDRGVRQVPERYIPRYGESIELRVIQSYQSEEFASDELAKLYQGGMC